MTTIAELLNEAQAQLVASDSPRLDAEVLLAYVTGRPRTHFIAWPEKELDSGQVEQFRRLVQRRAKGEPVAHITGRREFWSLNLEVTADTLIPRPETELLVEQALELIPQDAAWSIADLGTGSGAIALAIANERPGCSVVAVEMSAKALQVAEKNAGQLGISNITFVLGKWFEPLSGQRFELIVSNPPYIQERDIHLSEGDVRFEPRSALVSGEDGLDDIRTLVYQAKSHLLPDGWLLLEHGYDQGQEVRAIMKREGYRHVRDIPDYQGHDRVAIGRIPAKQEKG